MLLYPQARRSSRLFEILEKLVKTLDRERVGRVYLIILGGVYPSGYRAFGRRRYDLGKFDAESKKYVNMKHIFADAFNFLMHDGKQVIQPDQLFPVDTTEIAVPYGNGARTPVQKYRDSLKIWAAMRDQNIIYVLLGGEIQAKIHYAAAVKDMVYDALNYAGQVDQASMSYRAKKNEGDIVYGDNSVTIKLTSEEFLSGFRKEDKLIPVVTAVIYFGEKPWDGPLSLYEMFGLPEEQLEALKPFVPNYTVNLIPPKDVDEKDFDLKFSTGLGLAFNAIKHSQGNAVDILMNSNHRKIDRASAVFIKEVLNFDLEFSEPEEEGEVDMCKAVEDYTLKTKVLALIDYLTGEGNTKEEIIKKIVSKYSVTPEYVEGLMAA